MRTHFIVTNIDNTILRVIDHQGQCKLISPGKSILMHNPPKESYNFHIEPLTQEAEKLYADEFKTEGLVLKTQVEKKNEKQTIKCAKGTNKEVKN
jgi:hypothetical protein